MILFDSQKQPWEVRGTSIIISILVLRKLRLREVKSLTQGHIASKFPPQDFNSRLQSSEIPIILCFPEIHDFISVYATYTNADPNPYNYRSRIWMSIW